jgi:hypothetical protein
MIYFSSSYYFSLVDNLWIGSKCHCAVAVQLSFTNHLKKQKSVGALMEYSNEDSTKTEVTHIKV